MKVIVTMTLEIPFEADDDVDLEARLKSEKSEGCIGEYLKLHDMHLCAYIHDIAWRMPRIDEACMFDDYERGIKMQKVHIECEKCHKIIMYEASAQEPADYRFKKLWMLLEEHKRHLCRSCVHHFAECKGKRVFGECVGNDNVVECDSYGNKFIK